MPRKRASLSKRDDYSTERGIPFAIPKLYGRDDEFHGATFQNGSCGKPWLITVMVYASSESFKPEYGMGTLFFSKEGQQAAQAEIQHMRMVLFEGDIIHGIQESALPDGVETWRVSYVFKLVLVILQPVTIRCCPSKKLGATTWAERRSPIASCPISMAILDFTAKGERGSRDSLHRTPKDL